MYDKGIASEHLGKDEELVEAFEKARHKILFIRIISHCSCPKEMLFSGSKSKKLFNIFDIALEKIRTMERFCWRRVGRL